MKTTYFIHSHHGIERKILRRVCHEIDLMAQLCNVYQPESLCIKEHKQSLLFVKRVVDIFLSSVLILLTLPIMICASLLIKLISGGLVFFLQDRVGYKGQIFKMAKFTTMQEGSHKLDEEMAKSRNGNVCSRKHNDPRITKLGKFLRKYSIDELPQLFHVLSGKMSLVGPRPYAVYEFENLTDWQKKVKTSMKPGLTGVLQINGRTSVTDYNERIKMDLEYINNWSLWMDMNLIIKTIPIVIRGVGAS